MSASTEAVIFFQGVVAVYVWGNVYLRYVEVKYEAKFAKSVAIGHLAFLLLGAITRDMVMVLHVSALIGLAVWALFFLLVSEFFLKGKRDKYYWICPKCNKNMYKSSSGKRMRVRGAEEGEHCHHVVTCPHCGSAHGWELGRTMKHVCDFPERKAV